MRKVYRTPFKIIRDILTLLILAVSMFYVFSGYEGLTIFLGWWIIFLFWRWFKHNNHLIGLIKSFFRSAFKNLKNIFGNKPSFILTNESLETRDEIIQFSDVHEFITSNKTEPIFLLKNGNKSKITTSWLRKKDEKELLDHIQKLINEE